MNLCPQGHDKSVVGINKWRQCKTCVRDKNRARSERQRRARGIPARIEGLCQNGIHPAERGAGPCEPCLVARRAAYNARRRAGLGPITVREKAVPQPPDGLESEYGPVPDRVPGHLWVDRVALSRRLRDEPVGRDLTSGEVRALHLLEAIRG